MFNTIQIIFIKEKTEDKYVCSNFDSKFCSKSSQIKNQCISLEGKVIFENWGLGIEFSKIAW